MEIIPPLAALKDANDLLVYLNEIPRIMEIVSFSGIIRNDCFTASFKQAGEKTYKSLSICILRYRYRYGGGIDARPENKNIPPIYETALKDPNGNLVYYRKFGYCDVSRFYLMGEIVQEIYRLHRILCKHLDVSHRISFLIFSTAISRKHAEKRAAERIAAASIKNKMPSESNRPKINKINTVLSNRLFVRHITSFVNARPKKMKPDDNAGGESDEENGGESDGYSSDGSNWW